MTSQIELERFRLTSSRPFDEVLASIKGAVGHPDMVEFVFFSRKAYRYANDRCLHRRSHIRSQEQLAQALPNAMMRGEGVRSTDLFQQTTSPSLHSPTISPIPTPPA